MAAVGGDDRDHGLGNTWRACGHTPGGMEVRRHPGVSLMRHLQPIDRRDRHMVWGVHKVETMA